MLSMIDKPRIVGANTDPRRKDSVLKLVYFHGSVKSIDGLFARRINDKDCVQLPDAALDESNYHVRVFYWVGVMGITITEISVSFGSTWSYIYLDKDHVEAAKAAGDTHQHNLSDDSCVKKQIVEYEKRHALEHLARLKPSVFLELTSPEDPNEPDPEFEQEDLEP